MGKPTGNVKKNDQKGEENKSTNNQESTTTRLKQKH